MLLTQMTCRLPSWDRPMCHQTDLSAVHFYVYRLTWEACIDLCTRKNLVLQLVQLCSSQRTFKHRPWSHIQHTCGGGNGQQTQQRACVTMEDATCH